MTALILLAALQFTVAWTTVRLRGTRSVLTARPTLLLRDGTPCYDALRQQRVAFDELLQAVRGAGSGEDIRGDIRGLTPPRGCRREAPIERQPAVRGKFVLAARGLGMRP